MDAGSFSLRAQPLSGHLRGNHDHAKKIPLKARVETSFEKRAKISQLNWRLAKIGATFQATNQTRLCFLACTRTTRHNPGQKYLRNFFCQCALPKATKLFPNQRLPTNAQGSGFLWETQQYYFQEEGGRGESVRLRCVEMLPMYTISATALSKIVARGVCLQLLLVRWPK